MYAYVCLCVLMCVEDCRLDGQHRTHSVFSGRNDLLTDIGPEEDDRFLLTR